MFSKWYRKLSTSQFRYKVTKLILYDNYKHPKISKNFRFGKLFNPSKFLHSLFSTSYKIFWTTLPQSDHLAAYLFSIHTFTTQLIFILFPASYFSYFAVCILLSTQALVYTRNSCSRHSFSNGTYLRSHLSLFIRPRSFISI